MENIERYYVKQTETGFVICEINKTIPLPFNFIKKQIAEEYAKEFNKYGKNAIDDENIKARAETLKQQFNS